MSTATRTITITDPVGIHARPASQFAQAAAGQQRAAVGVERAGDGGQVGAQLVPVAVGCRLGMAKARVERNVALAGGGGQPCQQGGDGAAIACDPVPICGGITLPAASCSRRTDRSFSLRP